LVRKRVKCNMENVVIIGAVRTPIGAYGGVLRDVAVYRLAALVLNEAAKRAKIDPLQVDDVIMGTSYQKWRECERCENGCA